MSFKEQEPRVPVDIKSIYHPYPGCYFGFEGGDGGGKSTQRELLVERLQDLGYEVLSTREPGGTALGTEIRTWLLSIDREEKLMLITEPFLFAADRAQLLASSIVPILDRGGVAVSDRTFYSSLAYQGVGRGFSMEVIWGVNKHAVASVLPDVVIFPDIDPEEGLRRRRSAGDGKFDRLDGEQVSFHRRVYEAFLALAEDDPERWLRVDATKTAGEMHEIIWERVKQELRRRKLLEQLTSAHV